MSLIVLLLVTAGGQAALADDRALCMQAAFATEQEKRLPKAILQAIALTESGRFDPNSPGHYAWPWTINNAGDAYYMNSKSEAIAKVNELKARGERNIDVGCMQINLHFHPTAFANLETAFDPVANARYAATFLRQLRFDLGTWAQAIGRYHSVDQQRSRYYRKKVNKNWRNVRLGKSILDRQGQLKQLDSSLGPELHRGINRQTATSQVDEEAANSPRAEPQSANPAPGAIPELRRLTSTNAPSLLLHRGQGPD